MKNVLLIVLIGVLYACGDSNDRADAYGNFEATEINVSAEASGKILDFNIDEGKVINAGEKVGMIDTTQLFLSKQQILANKNGIASKSKNVLSQIAVYKEQLSTAEKEKERLGNMFANQAATQRQMDEVNGKVNVIKEQIKSVETQNAPIVNQLKSLDAQIAKINYQIKNSMIVNPIKGTVLIKYAEKDELANFGRVLYKIANLQRMTLRVYVSEKQLAQIKLHQEVVVEIDSAETTKQYKGYISWISSEAEFTPKIIQTKEERVNMVYAVKVDVENGGSIKIGMPADLWFNNPDKRNN